MASFLIASLFENLIIAQSFDISIFVVVVVLSLFCTIFNLNVLPLMKLKITDIKRTSESVNMSVVIEETISDRLHLIHLCHRMIANRTNDDCCLPT